MENNTSSSISKRLDFQSLREQGFRYQPTPWLVCYWLPTEEKKLRIVWNISRKVANAVVRNRLKRWCREFIRLHFHNLIVERGLDINLAFRPQSKNFYKDFRRDQIDSELCRIEKKIRNSLRKPS